MRSLLLCLCLCASARADTFTVDDDGPADFAQIAAAIAAVPAGSVLLVEPGNYDGFQLDKRLTVLGRAGGPRPDVGAVAVRANSFTLAGLEMDALDVQDVPGRGRIDDCLVEDDLDPTLAVAGRILGCAQLVISRSEFFGSRAFSQAQGSLLPAGAGLSILASHVTLVDCRVLGAKGFSDLSSNPGKGGDGLRISDGSEVLLAGCRIEGGTEGHDNCAFCICHDGPSGTGLVVTNSYVVLRGDNSDTLIHGFVDPLCPPFLPGRDLIAIDSTVVISGIQGAEDVELIDSALIEPALAEAFALLVGNDAPGGTRRLKLYGPAGAPALVALSVTPGLFTLGAWEGALWLDPLSLQVLPSVFLTGHDTPVVLPWTMPASTVGLEGVVVTVQPVFPTLPGALDPAAKLVGNATELVLRF